MTAPLLAVVAIAVLLLMLVTGPLGCDWLRFVTDIATHGPMPVPV